MLRPAIHIPLLCTISALSFSSPHCRSKPQLLTSLTAFTNTSTQNGIHTISTVLHGNVNNPQFTVKPSHSHTVSLGLTIIPHLLHPQKSANRPSRHRNPPTHIRHRHPDMDNMESGHREIVEYDIRHNIQYGLIKTFAKFAETSPIFAYLSPTFTNPHHPTTFTLPIHTTTLLRAGNAF